MTTLPLAGVRILAVSQLGAGPWALTLLSDLGADVIKVEPPGLGDAAREVPPFVEGEDSLFYQALNRGCRAITLDLREPEGQDILRRLVPSCSAVYNNLRGGEPAKLGLTYEALRECNPAVVCCSLSGFGQTGPRASEPGYDFLIQAYTGFMALTGDPGAAPTRCGVSVVDFSAGLVSVLGLMIGLRRAQETGLGADLDVSLYDTALSMLNYLASWSLSRDFHATRTKSSAHQSVVPVQTFETSDGYIVVMCMKEKFWERLCEILERPELLADDRFLGFASRLEHRDELLAILEHDFRGRTTGQWLKALRGVVPCGPVYGLEEALADEHAVAREMITAIDHPVFGSLKQVASPIKMSGVRPQYRRAAGLGEHTEEVLNELGGVAPEDIAALRRRGVI